MFSGRQAMAAKLLLHDFLHYLGNTLTNSKPMKSSLKPTQAHLLSRLPTNQDFHSILANYLIYFAMTPYYFKVLNSSNK